MLDEGLIAHASSEAMRTFLYGFYFYRIVEKESEKGKRHKQLTSAVYSYRLHQKFKFLINSLKRDRISLR